MTEITDDIGETWTSAGHPVFTHITRNPMRRRARRDDVAGCWAPPAAWLVLALVMGPHASAWTWMWVLALAVFAGCKWATWWPYRFHPAGPAHHAAFLFAHAGMDAEAFYLGPPAPTPSRSEWIATTAKSLAGVSLIILACVTVTAHPLRAAWLAMIGLILLLHFGLLDLLSLAWRARGVNAASLMRRPARAKSLADFWGRRWNTGFRTLAHDFIFDPLRRRTNATLATAAVFLASGVIHDLVISLPARGGYGRPTIYFLIQLTGLLIERTTTLRRTFARHAWLGRVFTIAVLISPLPLLFHESFIRNVIVPFLTTTIGGPS